MYRYVIVFKVDRYIHLFICIQLSPFPSLYLVSKTRKCADLCVCLRTWNTLTYYDWTHLIWNFGWCGYSQAFHVRSFAFTPPPFFTLCTLFFWMYTVHYFVHPLSFCIIHPLSTSCVPTPPSTFEYWLCPYSAFYLALVVSLIRLLPSTGCVPTPPSTYEH